MKLHNYQLNFLPMWLLPVLSIFIAAAPNIATDEAALLALQSQITSEILTYNWSTSVPVCAWVGITCGSRHNRVRALNLSHFGLEGSLSSGIGNLTSLKYLYLDHNNFGGEIPEEIGQLSKLETLSLSNNHFTGSIPRSIGNCTLLKEINVADNNITGEIPVEIGDQLPYLKSCKMDMNNLSGNLPSGVFNISTLQIFTVDSNNLLGSLPLTAGLFLPNLEELVLSRNKMHGTIPGSISNASKLTSIDFSDNLFAGSIPSALCDLDSLHRLNLGNNHLSIDNSIKELSFFSSLVNCRRLNKLVLSGNALNTQLPVFDGNISASLEQFWANNCNIKGRILAEFGNLTNLIALYLENNYLDSELPDTLGRMRRLQGLYLQENYLEGTIKPNVCQLDSLFELSLGGNKISGSIPECLGNLTALRHLNLSSNNISSIIPMTLWSLKDILSINISSNFLTGSLPPEIKHLLVVEEIDLSRNNLSGEIPKELQFLQSLAYLSLAKNTLQGHIPVSLNHSVSMEFLDLSFNKLSGTLPKSLEYLSHLKYFNVSFNELEGEIPEGGPFIDFSALSFLKNKALCGAKRLQRPPCKTVRTTRSGHHRHRPFIPMIMIPVIVSVMAALYLCKRCNLARELRNFPQKKARELRKEKPSHHSNWTFSDASELERYTYQEVELATSGFHESHLVGTGSFSSVYRGILHGGKVAIKVFKSEEVRSLLSFYVEFDLMQNPLAPAPRHRNIIRTFGRVEADGFLALIMEYMENGSLDDWLHSTQYQLNMEQRLNTMLNVASAIKYLHHDYARPIVHCDIKPSNVLLDEGMVAHLSDFSIAQLATPNFGDTRGESAIFGTLGYVAPEYGLQGIVSTKGDVYSFGIMLMEVFTGKRPTDDMFGGEMSLRNWAIKSLPHDIETTMDPHLLLTEEHQSEAKMHCFSSIIRLAYCCSSELPHDRLDMQQVLVELDHIRRSYIKYEQNGVQTEHYYV